MHRARVGVLGLATALVESLEQRLDADLVGAGAAPDVLLTATADGLPELAPGGHLLVVGDAALTQRCQELSGLPPERVYGWGGTPEAYRLRALLARELDVAPEDVQVCVMGGQPILRYTSVAGVPVLDLIGPERLEEVLQAPGQGENPLPEMVEAVLKDHKRIWPLATLLSGQYGVDGLYLDVPCKLGARGVEEVLELRLSEAEKAALHRSAREVRARLGR
jgi:malate dehydrogenase